MFDLVVFVEFIKALDIDNCCIQFQNLPKYVSHFVSK